MAVAKRGRRSGKKQFVVLLYACLVLLVVVAIAPVVPFVTPVEFRWGDRQVRVQAAYSPDLAADIPIPYGEVAIPQLRVSSGPSSRNGSMVYDYSNRWLRFGPIMYTVQTFATPVLKSEPKRRLPTST